MKAAVFHGRGDVRIEEVPAPRRPREGELLVDVILCSICGTDAAEYVRGPVLVPLESTHAGSGRGGPTILGHEFVGLVVAVGAGNGGFEPGDRVVSGAGVSCGSCEWCRAGRTNLCERYYTLGLHADGGLAEQVVVPAATCALVPDACSDRAAALAQPLAVALHALARGRLAGGETVAIVGAGGIGAFIVGAAVACGARVVLAIDVDGTRLEVAARLGAQHAIHADGAAGRVVELTGGGVDLAVEASGTSAGLVTAIAAVRRGGRLLLVGLHDEPRAIDLLDLTLREIDVVPSVAHLCATDLPAALDILASTDLADQVIDRAIPLDEVVDGGLVRLAGRQAHGKILVEVRG